MDFAFFKYQCRGLLFFEANCSFLSVNFFFFIHSDCRVFLYITSQILVNNICSNLLKSCQRKDNCY